MISIIIPTYNEEGNITQLVQYLKKDSKKNAVEIIVSDGGSTDNTLVAAQDAGAKAVLSPKKGRATQMNFGSSVSAGSILYFVHADTFPPLSYVSDIINAMYEGYEIGRYRTKFDGKKFILKINAFFTRFDWFVCNGGDQTLFITRKLFNKINGFNDNMHIMEDYDIVKRAKPFGRYKIFSKAALISARKYDTNSWLRVQCANSTIVKMYKKGASQEEMINKYKEMIIYR